MRVPSIADIGYTRGFPLFDRNRSRRSNKIHVTWLDTQTEKTMFEHEYYEMFGRVDGDRILEGHNPSILAVRL